MDLNVDPSLQIDIPDALSERDKVKFTVHTKVSGGMTSIIQAVLGCSLVIYSDKNLPELKRLLFVCNVAPLLSEHLPHLVVIL